MAAAQDTDVDQETEDQGTQDQGSLQSPFQPAGNSVIHWQDTAPADDSGEAAQPEQPEEPQQPRQFQPAGKSVIRWHQPPQQPAPEQPQPQQQPADQAEAQPSSQLAQMFPSYSFGAQPAQEPTAEGPPKAQPVSTDEPAIDRQAQSYTPYQDTRQIDKIILHSTDIDNEQSAVNTLTGSEPGHRVSAHYLTTEDGRSLHLVNDNDIAWHAGQTSGPNAQYNNANTIGIEQVHVDGQPWSEDEVKGTARTVAAVLQRHPNLSVDDVLGHSDIAPERKQDPLDFPWDRFRGYVNDALARTPTAPRAAPAAQQSNGLYNYENPQDFVTGQATTFGNKADIESGQDSGVGAPRLGSIPTTDVYGAAVPEWVLRSRLGNSPAAWRKARLDVVDPSSGNRLRVPIVDLGPSSAQEDKGIVADFTPGVDKYFNNQGGGKNLMFRLVKNAGPDVNSDTPDWNNEQAAIASGVDVGQTAKAAQTYPARTRGRGAAAAPTTVPWTVNWITDEEVAEARRQTQRDKLQALPDEMAALNNLQQQNQNPAAMMKALQQPIQGVSDDRRNDYLANYKQQVTKEAQQFYNEPDPDKALARAMQPAGPLEFAGETLRKVIPQFGQIDVGINRFAADTDQAQLNNFANALHPEAMPEGKAAFLDHLASLDPTTRAQTIGKLMSTLEPSVQASMNVVGIADAADRIADPKYQAAQNEAIQKKQNWLADNMAPDPRFKGTPAEWWTDQLSALPSTVLTAMLPPGISGSLFYAQLYSGAKDQLRDQHPNWSEEELRQKAGASAAVQLVPQEVLAHAIGGGFNRALEGIENPFKRAGAVALMNTGIGAAAGGAQQIGANVVAGQPMLAGVPEAAAGGAIQGGIPGLVHGAGELRRPVEARAEVPPGQPPPPEQPPPLRGEVAPPAEPLSTEPTPPAQAAPSGKPIPSGEESYVDPGRVTKRVASDEIHWVPADEVDQRWNTPDNKDFYIPPGGTENTIGQRYPDAITQVGGTSPMRAPEATVGEDGSVQFIDGRHRFAAMRDSGHTLVPLALDAESAENARATRLIQQGAPVETAPSAEKPPNALPTEPGPLEQGTDKYVSAIANRFVQQKVEAGDIGEIAPGQGYATKDLIAAGLKMSPEEVTQHMSDLMQGIGDPKAQAAAIRAEEARLSQRSAQASKIAEANPGDAQARIQEKNAFDDLTDFHNGPVAKLKNNWHASGMAMQGEHEVDLTTYNGQREAWLRDKGQPPSPEMEPAMRKSAAKAKRFVDIESAAMGNLSREIEKLNKRKLPSADEVRNNIMERLGIGPCITP